MALTVAAIVKRVVDARKMHSLGQQPSFGTPISGSPHLDQKSYNTEKTQSPHLKQQQADANHIQDAGGGPVLKHAVQAGIGTAEQDGKATQRVHNKFSQAVDATSIRTVQCACLERSDTYIVVK